MEQILLETITAEEKAIVEDEWEMAVVNYANSNVISLVKLPTHRRS